MVDFAHRLGIRHSTVSMYESGKLQPSRTILILLLQLAVDDTEKAPLLDALGVGEELLEGWAEGELEAAVRTFDAYVAAKKPAPARRRKPEMLADFARAAGAIVDRHETIEPALVYILEAWLRHGKNPRARQFFRHVQAYLEVELTALEGEEKKHRGRS